MNYLLAVSGGVDSVALLHMMAHTGVRSSKRVIVAHVDHGIRTDSAGDARFVVGLAHRYDCMLLEKRFELGNGASEDEARKVRYEWLFEMADVHHATLVTAHHQDDLVGSVAINIIRGTGWRGLAVMNRRGIRRPLLSWRKQAIYEYALAHRLEWVEDETNHSVEILRNRIKGKIGQLSPETSDQLRVLRNRQIELARQIDHEQTRLVTQFGDRRYEYTCIRGDISAELLRTCVMMRVGVRPTRDDAERLMMAVRTARPGVTLQLAGGIRIDFTRDRFVVARHQK